MKNLQYQPEIDGVRAIAVISVVLFHLEYSFIPGGFVGVDIFFVISGFLITRILYRDVQREHFSFAQFYLRRIRRLAPALIVVLLGTFLISSLYLTPTHFERFSTALIAALFSVSNIFFWFESGYFDASADLKPLLHTWSLSVEEQFYLLWPALIYFTRGLSRRALLGVFLTLGTLSLLAARVFSTLEPTAAFFLMPFRVYEFALGAALALLPAWTVASKSAWRWCKELVCISGLLLIVFSLLWFDKSKPFPDVYALLPCIGAAMLIAAGNTRYSGWLLSNPVSVWFGAVSYSLYLVHWPVVVLYKHISFEDVVVGKTRMALLLITLILAYLLHRFVENRFRYPSASNTLQHSLTWLLLPLALLLASAHASQHSGWAGRFDPVVIHAIGDIEAKQQLRRRYIESPDAAANQPFDTVLYNGQAPVKVLVMGDSHANDLFNALYLNLKDNPAVSVRRLEIDDTCLYLFTHSATEQTAQAQHRCERQFAAVQSSEVLRSADWAILSTRWERQSLTHLPAFVAFLNARGPTPVLTSRTAEFKNVPSLVVKNGLSESIEAKLWDARDTTLDALNTDIARLAQSLHIPYVEKLPYLCTRDRHCDIVDTSGRILYTDYGHWTLEGAQVFGQRLLQDPVLQRVLALPSDV